jgi:hypothetical protein
MKFVSIDVGIKNCSYCLFSVSHDKIWDILKWGIVDLSNQEKPEKYYCHDCECKKPAKFVKNNTYYCLKHSKKTTYTKIPSELKNINKKKNIDIINLLNKYNISYSKTTKQDLINCVNQHIIASYFDEMNKPTISVNSSKINLNDIGKNIKLLFNEIFLNDIHTIDNVIIENQIAPIANRMKTIQGMISMYFIMNNSNINIEYISSFNKLSLSPSLETTKITYTERKKLGIKICIEELLLLRDKINCSLLKNKWVDFFNQNKKKDDLSDCFLQGLWWIKKQIIENEFVYIFK